jgi:uncharacterized protein (DUF2132 family)
MNTSGSNDPLHGVTLEAILRHLEKKVGWRHMAREIPIRCFMFDPSITSSLKFLRKTPWARAKTEQLYLATLPKVRAPAPTKKGPS